MAAPVVESVLELNRETPLVRIRVPAPTTVWAKCEYLLPTGSIKDRIADRALAHAGAKSGDVVVLASSGQSAAAVAIAATLRGVKVIATMSRHEALEKRSLLRALGVELVLTPAADGLDGAVAESARIAKERGATEIRLNAPDGARAMAREIIDAIGSEPDYLVLGMGSGTTAEGFMHAMPSVPIVFASPESRLTRIAGLVMGRGLRSYDFELVPDARAWSTCRALAREQGLLVGPSAGACVAVASDLASTLSKDDCIVTILGDTGERYFSIAQFFEGAPP